MQTFEATASASGSSSSGYVTASATASLDMNNTHAQNSLVSLSQPASGINSHDVSYLVPSDPMATPAAAMSMPPAAPPPSA